MENLSLLSIKLCSPMVVFIIYVIVSAISLYMTRGIIKKYNNQRMDNLYNLYSWNEIKLIIVTGVIIYGLCQYDQVNLAWIFLLSPIVYLMVKNLFAYYYITLAYQNAPKEETNLDLFNKLNSSKNQTTNNGGASILPLPPTVKKDIFGIRGDPEPNKPVIDLTNSLPPKQPPSPPSITPPSPPPQSSLISEIRSEPPPQKELNSGMDSLSPFGGFGAPF